MTEPVEFYKELESMTVLVEAIVYPEVSGTFNTCPPDSYVDFVWMPDEPATVDLERVWVVHKKTDGTEILSELDQNVIRDEYLLDLEDAAVQYFLDGRW